MKINSITKPGSAGKLKQLALGAVLGACSLVAQAGVLSFEDQRDVPIIFTGEHNQFGEHWVESYGGTLTTDLAGLIVDGASQDDICADIACPVNNQSKYYTGLSDAYFYFGLNNNANFRATSLQASFLGAGQASFSDISAILLMEGFDINDNPVGPSLELPLFGPNNQGLFEFSSYDLGLFSSLTVNYVRVLGYACTGLDCSRATGLANFAIDNIETTTVPEPATLGLFGLGLLGLGLFMRKRAA